MTRKGLRSRNRWFVVFLLAACGGPEGDTGAVPDTPEEAADLSAAGNTVIRFLQGTIPFDSIALADTVTLHIAPEGGGGNSVYAREELRSPSNWNVVSGGRSFRLIPPPEATTLTTKTSRHFNCMEYDLSSRNPELSRLPHVGTKLQPERQSASCLVAAVYDQWEW